MYKQAYILMRDHRGSCVFHGVFDNMKAVTDVILKESDSPDFDFVRVENPHGTNMSMIKAWDSTCTSEWIILEADPAEDHHAMRRLRYQAWKAANPAYNR